MSTGPIDTSADVPKDVNGRSIWPLWTKQREWQQKVEEQAVRKALDIPSDDMNITTTKTGISAGGAAAIAAAAGIPSTLAAGALGAAMLFGGGDKTPEAPAATPEAAAPADSDYEVRFWDAHGNPIDVPHISTKPAE